MLCGTLLGGTGDQATPLPSLPQGNGATRSGESSESKRAAGRQQTEGFVRLSRSPWLQVWGCCGLSGVAGTVIAAVAQESQFLQLVAKREIKYAAAVGCF